MKLELSLTKSTHRILLFGCLFIALLATGCGTFQVDLAPTPAPVARPGVRLTPTPWFGPAPFVTEAGVTFDDRMKLVGFTVKPETAGPGSRVTVTLIWQVMGKVDANYNTFVHMVNEEEQLLAQSDAPTGGGLRLPADWIINEYIYDQHHLVLPNSMSLNDVEIRIGLYDFDEGQRVDLDSPNSYTLQMVASPTPYEPIPEVVSPKPTETPQISPQIEESDAGPLQESLEVRVAYVKEANVWIWDAANGSVQLTLDGGVEDVRLSDDGQQIAFMRDQNIWVVDSNGGNERQLTHEEDFQGLDLDQELEPFVTGIRPVHVAWRPDSQQLFFNTSPQIDGPGLILSDDLWQVDVDSGELSMMLPPGAGGNFQFSPDGQKLAIVTPGRIDLTDADGNNRREAFTHTPVITFSEFEYYAQPVWAADSGSLLVAIPPADSSAAFDQPTSIWQIPVEDRPAWLIGQITTLPGAHRSPLFAPNLARLAYLVPEPPEDKPDSMLPTMAVAEMSESVIWDPVVFPVEAMLLHGWSPDGIRLLFTSSTDSLAEIAMGQPDVRTLINGDEKFRVANLAWTDNMRFLYEQHDINGWEILLGRVDGSDPVLVDAGTNLPVSYDFTWVPREEKTGIPQVDTVIDVILSNDLDERLELVRFANAGCTTADGLGSTPKCKDGQAEGTPVEFLPLGGPGEGSSVSSAEVAGVLQFEAEALYAAYLVAGDLPDDPAYPHGTYALIFSTSGNGSDAESVVIRVDDEGQIVRLDHLGMFPVETWFRQKTADLIDPPPQDEIFASEAAEILAYPAGTKLPEGPLPQSLKGYTLQSYTWDEQWYFTLTVGLNAVTPCEGEGAAITQDVPSYSMQGVDALKAALDRLQPGEYVTWCSAGQPDAEVVEDVKVHSEQIGIHLSG